MVGELFHANGFLPDAYEDKDSDPQLWYPTYEDALTQLAVDLADRLMSVLDTLTGILYGTANLYYALAGVMY